jgi:hypothetical protein
MTIEEESYDGLTEEVRVLRHVIDTAHDLYSVECEVHTGEMRCPARISTQKTALPSLLWLQAYYDTEHVDESDYSHVLKETKAGINLGNFRVNMVDWIGPLVGSDPVAININYCFPELFSVEFLAELHKRGKTNCLCVWPRSYFRVACMKYSEFLYMPRDFTNMEIFSGCWLTVPRLTINMTLCYKGDIKDLQNELLRVYDEALCQVKGIPNDT